MQQTKKSSEKRFTYGDYCTWPEDERWELIDGVPFDMTPAPSRQHSKISGSLFYQFYNFFSGKPCEVHNAPFDVRLPRNKEPDDKIDTVVQPDILVVCDEKKLDDKGCRGAPDLVVEIISPSTASRDNITKKALYEKHGVKEYWLVSPTDRLVTIYRLEPDGEFGKSIIFCDTDKIEVPLFPGLEIDLTSVFPALPRIVRESPRKYL
ncbi:MAG: Uma2 family endonuclease [Candidatus Riflebacteria bacterium]|nr:Uma2 family endonuclease [Candidatus Riflebacteria bacterium]